VVETGAHDHLAFLRHHRRRDGNDGYGASAGSARSWRAPAARPPTRSVSRMSFRFLGLSSTMRMSSFATPPRHCERECRALSHLALDPDLAPVKFDELA